MSIRHDGGCPFPIGRRIPIHREPAPAPPPALAPTGAPAPVPSPPAPPTRVSLDRLLADLATAQAQHAVVVAAILALERAIWARIPAHLRSGGG